MAATRRVLLRLVPFLMVCYFCALLDRLNIGFAALHMNKDLGLTRPCSASPRAWSSCSASWWKCPSNLVLQKYGARRWIARIMISCGLVTVCMASWSDLLAYAKRFLLGAAEAGIFPGRSPPAGCWPAASVLRILQDIADSRSRADIAHMPVERFRDWDAVTQPLRVGEVLRLSWNEDATRSVSCWCCVEYIDHCIQVVLECAWWPEDPGVDDHEEMTDVVWLVGLPPSTSRNGENEPPVSVAPRTWAINAKP